MQQASLLNANHTAFTNLPPGAEGHFLLHFYAVVARLLANLRTAHMLEQGTKYFEQFPFLDGYQQMLGSYLPAGLPSHQALSWWDTAIANWETQSSCHLPLRALVDEVGLSI